MKNSLLEQSVDEPQAGSPSSLGPMKNSLMEDKPAREAPSFVDEPGLEEAFNPVSVFASIFTGGASILAKRGLSLGVAAGRSALMASVGTASDVPISLSAELVRDRYGWGPALTYELATSLAVGMTAEDFLVNKLSRLGRSLGGMDTVKQMLKRNPEEAAKQMDELDKILNLVDDQPKIREAVKALPPGQAKGDVLDTIKFEQPAGENPIPLGPVKTEGQQARSEYAKTLTDRMLSEEAPPLEAPRVPGRPSEPLRQPVDKKARMDLIKRIAGEKQPAGADEIKADSSILMDEMTPRLQDEVPAYQGKSSQEDWRQRAERETREFLGDDVELTGTRYSDEAHYSDEDVSLDEISVLEEGFDDLDEAGRPLDETLEDLYAVFKSKIGMSIEDITRSTDAGKEAALNRLSKDLKKHAAKANRLGMGLEEYYQSLGFSPEMSTRWKKYTDYFQDVTQDAAQRGEAETEAARAFRSPARWLSVEAPFRRVGAPETGFAFKNHASTQDMYEEEGLLSVEKLVRDGLKDEDVAHVAFKASEPGYDMSEMSAAQQARVEDAAKKVREYFDKSFKDYEAVGGLENPFPQSAILRREENITKWEALLADSKHPRKKERLATKIKRAKDEISILKETEYVPILKQWFDRLDRTKPEALRRVVQVKAQKRRETPLLSQLVDEGLVSQDEIDIRQIIGAYARQKGRDIANLNLRNAMEQDGLIKRIKWRDRSGKVTKRAKSDWAQVSPTDYPMFKDYAVHPVMHEYLQTYYRAIGRHSRLEQVMNTTKMFQFFNPIILPMYDTYQSAMLHNVKAWKIPKSAKEGIESFFRQDEHYWNAHANGLFSKPYPNPVAESNRALSEAAAGGGVKGYLDAWKDSYKMANLPMKNRLGKIMAGIPAQTLRNIYSASWDMAWAGDKLIRMVSYRHLIDEGFEPRDAGQMAAMFHGDYASVPPQTRKQLNKFFFTPTFKIAMAKAQGEMAKAAVKTFTETGQMKLPDKKTRTIAGGLAALIAANWAKDQLMARFEFERDQWGRRYFREVETDEGPKEVVVTFSDPTNVLLKYMQKAYEVSFNDVPETEKTAWGRMLKSFQHEIHPALRIGIIEMANNRKWDDTEIYLPHDSAAVKGFKSLEYLAGQVAPIVQPIGIGDRESDEDEIIRDQFGGVWKHVVNKFVFPYVRGPRARKIRRDINQIHENLRRGIEKGAGQDYFDRAMEEIRRIQERASELESSSGLGPQSSIETTRRKVASSDIPEEAKRIINEEVLGNA